MKPSLSPTIHPTSPTIFPTLNPTTEPSLSPSTHPTSPAIDPSLWPTLIPTFNPTVEPSLPPTNPTSCAAIFFLSNYNWDINCGFGYFDQTADVQNVESFEACACLCKHSTCVKFQYSELDNLCKMKTLDWLDCDRHHNSGKALGYIIG